MTTRGSDKSDRTALERLADVLVEDILSTPDGALPSEAEACNDDGARIARAAFHKALGVSGRRRAGMLKEVPLPWHRSSVDVRSLDLTTARRWLDEFGARDPETARKLTASEAGQNLSDEDVYELLEFLQGRGALGPRIIGHERG